MKLPNKICSENPSRRPSIMGSTAKDSNHPGFATPHVDNSDLKSTNVQDKFKLSTNLTLFESAPFENVPFC